MSKRTPDLPTPATDLVAIDTLMREYLWGVDERDFELVASCFAVDAEATYNDVLAGRTRDEIVTWLRSVLGDDPRRSPLQARHLPGGSSISLRGDEATCRTSAMAHLVRRDEQGERTAALRAIVYDDELRRIDGRWVVQRRLVSLDWAYAI